MKLYRFRALLRLDPAGDGEAALEYPCGTHSLMVVAGRLGRPGETRYFPAAIYRVDGQPLRRGEPSAVVTIEIADDEAGEFLDAGQPVTVWNGADTGHGVVSRRVFFTPVG
jgi:hypothetical protein